MKTILKKTNHINKMIIPDITSAVPKSVPTFNSGVTLTISKLSFNSGLVYFEMKSGKITPARNSLILPCPSFPTFNCRAEFANGDVEYKYVQKNQKVKFRIVGQLYQFP